MPAGDTSPEEARKVQNRSKANRKEEETPSRGAKPAFIFLEFERFYYKMKEVFFLPHVSVVLRLHPGTSCWNGICFYSNVM